MSFAEKGVPSLLVLSVPDEIASSGSSVHCFAVPILSRRGGLLLNIPRGVISEDGLIDSLQVEDESCLLGPSKGVSAHLCEEDEEGNIALRQESVNSLVIDFSDDVLPLLREYGASGPEEDEIVPFAENFPTALPSFTEVCVATPQEALSESASPEVRRGAWTPVLFGVSREDGRLPFSSGKWSDDVVDWPRDRCSGGRGSSYGKGASCPLGHIVGTVSGGQRRLVDCIPAEPRIRASPPDVPGEVQRDVTFWPTVCGACPPILGGNSSGLRERARGPQQQEGRSSCSKEEEEFGVRRSFPEKARPTKVPKEAQGRASSSVSLVEAKDHEGIHRLEEAVNDNSFFFGDGLHDGEKRVPDDPFSQTFSVHRWCSNLVTSVFRSRTSFASFVRYAIHLPRDSRVSSSPVFPIPLPFVGAFDRMPSGLSKRHRLKTHFRRAVVVVVLALNFWWSGNRFISTDLLRRSLSPSQKQIVRRVIDFIQVDGPMIPFPVVSAGPKISSINCKTF